MGEVVISSEEFEVGNESDKKVESDDGKIRWENLFPGMVLRVLLVEADDSTRQIIAALLRKCSYKVTAVPDGLKAWEMLKGRPQNIDLILTEVDLPSISGYALLTLIMGHDICKNIPVIMMSTHDSVSTVYKCMLRGAADYLVKPIRKNELRNLWQHVWRRRSSLAGGSDQQDESVGQDKVEATSENNAASNNSTDNRARIQNNKELLEKGSDAQSSCTKPDMEAESAPVENVREFLQPAWGNLFLNDKRIQKHEGCVDCSQKLCILEDETGGKTVAADVEPESRRVNIKTTNEAFDNRCFLVKSPRQAIDFMGTSASRNSSVDNTQRKFDFFPQLDLCLTRHQPSDYESRVAEDRRTLRHSDASAFTRYAYRPLHLGHTCAATDQKELRAYSDRKFSSNISDYNSDAPGPPSSADRTIVSLPNDQTKESEIAITCPQERVFLIQTPVNGAGFNNVCTSYGSMFPSASPVPSPSSGSHPDPNCKVHPFRHSSFKSTCNNLYDRFVQTANDATNQSLKNQDKRLDSLEGRGHISPTTDQSATSSLCNGAASHLNMGYGSTSGSNSNLDWVANPNVPAERKNEESLLHGTNPHRSIQREVALTKFRLKRKDRCYEKKVRYESRKKLAEQRPRVKGQFVRQTNPQPVDADE